jgi:hypothetical protein
MHGHGHDQIERLVAGKRPDEQAAQRVGETLDFGVLKEMNKLAQRTVVTAKGVNCVEVDYALPADVTEAVFIEWIMIHERCAAGAAEELGS